VVPVCPPTETLAPLGSEVKLTVWLVPCMTRVHPLSAARSAGPIVRSILFT